MSSLGMSVGFQLASGCYIPGDSTLQDIPLYCFCYYWTICQLLCLFGFLSFSQSNRPARNINFVRFGVLRAVTMKYTTFWDNAPCSPAEVSRDSAVGIATGYKLDDRGVGIRVPVDSKIFSSPHRPDRLWGPPSLLSNGYRGSFPRGLSSRGVKLTIHLQLVPSSRKYGSTHPLPPYVFMG
jgi:hypothetical protein